MKRKGVSPLIAAVIYTTLVLTAVGIILNTGLPAVERLKDVNLFEQAQNRMSALNAGILEVASEGKGSTRVVLVEIKKGEIVVDASSDEIYYFFETDSGVLAPRMSRKIGDLTFRTNANVEATEGAGTYTLSNEHLDVIINKYGNETNPVSLNSSRLVNKINFKGDAISSYTGDVSIIVNNNPSLQAGTGYTELTKTGKTLGKASVIAHVNSTGANYDVYLTLDSHADFLIIEVKNYEVV